MKINVGILSQEGFESGFVILFENGLELRTKSVFWMVEEEKDKVRQQFDEVVARLQERGFELSEDVK